MDNSRNPVTQGHKNNIIDFPNSETNNDDRSILGDTLSIDIPIAKRFERLKASHLLIKEAEKPLFQKKNPTDIPISDNYKGHSSFDVDYFVNQARNRLYNSETKDIQFRPNRERIRKDIEADLKTPSPKRSLFRFFGF
ncbi:hypothetical protein [Bacillus cereus]|uniref:hypothetical protein n=1 Tax=Bacillus cereus TaxID=1396 RepID=UPI000B4BB9FA|nr:hypothetical protein [Bacillus cereus]